MKLTFYYVCQCGCQWSTVMSARGLSFIDSSCACPSCGEENEAESTQLS